MKKKTFVLVGIAVCVLLLTSPALASAGYSKIYGNANEDDVLDMRDVTYIKLVIFGKKPATTLADANYDGKISMLDIGQTKLIILGKEKELTLVDMLDRIVTVPRPIERVVSSYVDATRLTIALDACDKLVGIKEYDPICLCSDGELCAAKVCGGRVYDGIPVVGGKCGKLNLNLEFTISLKPDVILGSLYVDSATANSVQEKTGIPVVCVESGGHSNKFEDMYESIELIGEVLEKGGEAEELISFINEKIAKVMKVTSQIPEEEKQRVYFATRGLGGWAAGGSVGLTTTTGHCEPIDVAGGINVAEGLLGRDVLKEQVIEWDPDIIIVACNVPSETTDLKIVLNDPLLQDMTAVRNGDVYHCLYPYCCGIPQDRNLINTMYLAKLFYPEKFKDLDLEEEGNEIMGAFLGVDGLCSEFADYTVWMREYVDRQR